MVYVERERNNRNTFVFAFSVVVFNMIKLLAVLHVKAGRNMRKVSCSASLRNGVLFVLAWVAWVACLCGWRASVGGVLAWVACMRGCRGWREEKKCLVSTFTKMKKCSK